MKRRHVTWRYLPFGKVRHALRSSGRSMALCGVRVVDPWEWCGTGSQREYERVKQLPECKRCARELTP